ncbi:hypothetical protein E4T52_00022 [Aureobasidium sp. EXF-3400]|nr:hypothetical protein E4T51_01928 [Aureobasidium sp. EXF-12344]KAI4784944.1 hypothetical protein E4T52_00022 [Aureobasidium sp. EXF-3400]
MPPKRSKKRAADAEAPTTRAKSSKKDDSTTAGAASNEAAQEEPAVQNTESTSQSDDDDSNVADPEDHDMNEAMVQKDPYTYIRNCAPRFEYEARYAKEHEDDEDFDEEKASELWADEHNNRKCACFNKERTDGWSMMRKAFARKMDAETIEIPQRDPDNFNMYVYNDFAGYGYQEVVENNILEFNKVLNSKDGKTEELWTIVESMVWWMVEEPHAPWHMIDDGERSMMTHSLLGFMFLTALNRIDQDGDLKPDSKYKDLSRVMALWAKASEDLGTDMDEDPLADKKSDNATTIGEYAGFNMVWFRYLIALAKEAGVPIEGVTDIADQIEDWNAQAEGKVKLPAKKADRFGWKTKYQKYTKQYGRGGKIGGTAFQIPYWTRQRRTQYAYDKKDPLKDEDIKALKEGKVLQMM